MSPAPGGRSRQSPAPQSGSPAFQVGAHPAGQVVLGGHVLRPLQPVVHRHAVHPVPEVAGKAAPLLRHGQKGPGIGDGAAGLAPVLMTPGAARAASTSSSPTRPAPPAQNPRRPPAGPPAAPESASSSARPESPPAPAARTAPGRPGRAGTTPCRGTKSHAPFCPGTARALSHVSSPLSFPARLGRETRYHLHYSIEMGKWKPAGKVIAEKKIL